MSRALFPAALRLAEKAARLLPGPSARLLFRHLFRPLFRPPARPFIGAIARIAVCAAILFFSHGLTEAGAAGPAFLPLEPSDPSAPSGLESGMPPVLPLPAEALPDTAPAPRPQAPDARERDLQRRGIVRAELRPGRPLLLSAPFPGVLASVPVRDGEAVRAGDSIAVFDTENAAKGVEEAKLALAEAIAAVENAGEASERERERVEASLARNADLLREAEDKFARSTLSSPFDGRVTEVRAKAGQHVRRGDVVAELAETGDLEIVCSVPSSWVNHLKPGHIIWVYVEERGKSYEAEFVRFGGKVDSATRTIRAYSRFLPPPDSEDDADGAPPGERVSGRPAPDELLPGMSGRADFFPRRQADGGR